MQTTADLSMGEKTAAVKQASMACGIIILLLLHYHRV